MMDFSRLGCLYPTESHSACWRIRVGRKNEGLDLVWTKFCADELMDSYGMADQDPTSFCYGHSDYGRATVIF
jgi:hypothetical protein